MTPYFVFDGDYLPRKAGTEQERLQRRETFKAQAMAARRAGNDKLAFQCFQKACDVTPELAKSLIERFKARGIKYVVAPYEADSQMVHLEKSGLVQAIISEDSDLLVFGAQTLLTKMTDRGHFIQIKRSDFINNRGSKIATFDDDQLLLMATISGCDYTKGIPKFGIQKSIIQVAQYKTYDRVMLSIKVDGKNQVPATFDDEYKRAQIAFRHQVVFNPVSQKAEHLNPLDQAMVENYGMDFICQCTGNLLNDEIHQQVANGDLHPHEKTALFTREEKLGLMTVHRSNSVPVATTNEGELHTVKRAATFQDVVRKQSTLTYRSSKQLPSANLKQRRALENIINFTNKVQAPLPPQRMDENRGPSSTSALSSSFSHINKKQKTFVYSNIDTKSTDAACKSRFFKSSSSNASSVTASATTSFSASSSFSSSDFTTSLKTATIGLLQSSSAELPMADKSDIEIGLSSDDKLQINSSLIHDEMGCLADTTVIPSQVADSSELMTDIEEGNELDTAQFAFSTPTKKSKGLPFTLLDEIKDTSMAETSNSDASEVGDVNIECFLPDGDHDPDDSFCPGDIDDEPDTQKSPLANKGNILDEIYGFPKAGQSGSGPPKKSFSENFVYKVQKNVRKPSPLGNGLRKPLGEINVNQTKRVSNLERFMFNGQR